MNFARFMMTLLAIPIVMVSLKLMWMFTIPEIFPGAVSKGLVAASLSWKAALKIAVFTFLVELFFAIRR